MFSLEARVYFVSYSAALRALSVRLNCQQAVDTTHLIDTVGVIFTDGPSTACSGDSHHRLNQQSRAQLLACRGLWDTLASGKVDESKV